MRLIVCFFCLFLMEESISQPLRFKFLNGITNEFITDIEVSPEFEVLDYKAFPLVYDKKNNWFYYKNDLYPKPPKKSFKLYISSYNYYFSEGPIIGQMLPLVESQCDSVCIIKVSPTIRMDFVSKGQRGKIVKLGLNVKCDSLLSIISFSDKFIYITGECKQLSQAKAEFSFQAEKNIHTVYLLPYDTATVTICDTNLKVLSSKEILLDPKKNKIIIHLDCTDPWRKQKIK